MELTVIAKAHLAVDVLLWLDMSVFLHWLKRSKYPQKCTQCSQFLFFASAKWWVHIILSILRNWWHSKWSQRWERKALSWRTLPPTPKEIKIKQQEKRKEYLQRWQSKSQRSDHNFLGLKYRNAHLKYISVIFSRTDWQLIRPCPHLWVSACLLRNTDTCLCSRHALSLNWADGRSPLVLVIWCFSLWLLKFPVMLVRICVCAVLRQFLDPSLGTLLTVEM